MLAKDTRILVVMGGWSAERDVSLETGRAVLDCLKMAGYDARGFDLGDGSDHMDILGRLLGTIRSDGIQAVYIALHGPLGEDGTIQGLLDLAGVPYNGSGVLASALGLDKVFAKQIFVAGRITTPKHAVVPKGSSPKGSPLPLPVVVKPRSLGSSIGVSLVEKADDLNPALDKVYSLGQDALVEQYIQGRELQAAVLDGVPLPLVEVISANRLYDYEAKYTVGKSEHKTPAPLPHKQYEAVQRLAQQAYAVLGCEGVARAEIIAENTGTLYVLEVNTLPGMTPTSIVPEAAREAGISFIELVAGEIERGMARRGRRA
jgi:D-alanine-D-alanine ligase